MTGLPHIALVIPCFNESKRLPPFLEELVTSLKPINQHITVLVADDGSQEREREVIRHQIDGFRSRGCDWLAPLLEFNHRGKGGTILEAWKHAPPESTHYGFVDADGAVPAAEVARFLDRLLQDPDDRRTCYFAVRKTTATTRVQRKWSRKIIGKVYYAMVNLLLGSAVADPACGLKALSKNFYEEIGPRLTEQEWALDIEMLAWILERRYPLEEIPISWIEKGGSKIAKMDLWRILKQIVIIRRRMKRWREHRQSP